MSEFSTAPAFQMPSCAWCGKEPLPPLHGRIQLLFDGPNERHPDLGNAWSIQVSVCGRDCGNAIYAARGVHGARWPFYRAANDVTP
jgi:hypothetical protein